MPLEEKWRGVPGLFPGIILQGDAGIDQVQPTGAPPPSSPSVLSSRLGVELRTSAMLGASIGRSESVRAFEMEATIRVASWTSQADGGFSKRKGPQGEPLKAPAVGVLGAGGLRLDVIGASLDLSP